MNKNEKNTSTAAEVQTAVNSGSSSSSIWVAAIMIGIVALIVFIEIFSSGKH